MCVCMCVCVCGCVCVCVLKKIIYIEKSLLDQIIYHTLIVLGTTYPLNMVLYAEMAALYASGFYTLK